MKENLSKKNEFCSNPKFRKMSQIGQGGPPRNPKNPKNILGPKGPWAQFWAQGRRHEAAALEI